MVGSGSENVNVVGNGVPDGPSEVKVSEPLTEWCPGKFRLPLVVRQDGWMEYVASNGLTSIVMDAIPVSRNRFIRDQEQLARWEQTFGPEARARLEEDYRIDRTDLQRERSAAIGGLENTADTSPDTIER